MRQWLPVWLSPAILLVVAGCGDSSVAPDFPDDYKQSYVEVRDCRKSGDHDLHFIRVLADPDARGPFLDRATPFPDGAVVLKEEYDFADDTCTGEILQWTVMVKNAAASDRLGWDWQRVDSDRNVVEDEAPRCFGCHQSCTGTPPEVGYDFTCAEP